VKNLSDQTKHGPKDQGPADNAAGATLMFHQFMQFIK